MPSGSRRMVFYDCRSKGEVDAGAATRHKHREKAKVCIAHSHGIASPTIKGELRRRKAIGPILGHTKSDGLLERNHLAAATGDAIHAIMAAARRHLIPECGEADSGRGFPRRRFSDSLEQA